MTRHGFWPRWALALFAASTIILGVPPLSLEAAECGPPTERFFALCENGMCTPVFMVLEELVASCARLPYLVEWDQNNPDDPLASAPNGGYIRQELIAWKPAGPADVVQALFDLAFEGQAASGDSGLYELRTDGEQREIDLKLWSDQADVELGAELMPELILLSERGDEETVEWWRDRLDLATRQARFFYRLGRALPFLVALWAGGIAAATVYLIRKNRRTIDPT